MKSKQASSDFSGHQVELGDDRSRLLDNVELAVPVDDVLVVLLGLALLDGGVGRGLLPGAKTISPHNWLVRLAEGLSDRHQLALR